MAICGFTSHIVKANNGIYVFFRSYFQKYFLFLSFAHDCRTANSIMLNTISECCSAIEKRRKCISNVQLSFTSKRVARLENVRLTSFSLNLGRLSAARDALILKSIFKLSVGKLLLCLWLLPQSGAVQERNFGAKISIYPIFFLWKEKLDQFYRL